MKKRTSVYIDAELLEKAKERKLNLSQLLEWAIKEVLNGKKKQSSAGLLIPQSGVQIPPGPCLLSSARRKLLSQGCLRLILSVLSTVRFCPCSAI